MQVFQAGSYDLPLPATWATGDWNGDGRFDSTDLVLAFAQGDYRKDDAVERAVAAMDAGLFEIASALI